MRRYCPACESETSTIAAAFDRGEPCPGCGLSAEAAGEFMTARQRGAEWDSVARAAKAEARAQRAEAVAAELRERLAAIARLAAGVGA